MKKIDMHCHTTNRNLDTLIGNASIGTIREQMKLHEVEKTVLLATYFPHRGSGISNFRLLNWISGKPEFVMFGSLDFENYFFQGINELNELAETSAIKGIKIYTCYQNVDLKSEKMGQLVGLAKKHSLPLAFHCGYSYTSMKRYGTPTITNMVKASDLEPLLKENPDVNFLACHLSKPFLYDLIRVTKENRNLHTDTSGLIDSKYESPEVPLCVEEVRRYLEECGPNNLLFGTDFPVQSHEHSVQIVEGAMKNFSEPDKNLVYYENARRLLKL
jgi:uncharacterized protein